MSIGDVPFSALTLESPNEMPYYSVEDDTLPVYYSSPEGEIGETYLFPSDGDSLPTVSSWISSLEGNYRSFGYFNGGFPDRGYVEFFSVEDCNRIMGEYIDRKTKILDVPGTSLGEMVSQELNEDGYIIVHGDLHTDLHGLIERFKYLQTLGFLTENYKVASEDSQELKVVFLGDYFGRGRDGVKLFMFLLLFKMENWNTVDLYRGNHESSTLGVLKRDFSFLEQHFLENMRFRDLLLGVFSSLILRGYYCCATPGENNRKEHIVMSHGVPGYYPSAIDVIAKKSLFLIKKDKLGLHDKIVEIKNMSRQELLENKLSKREINRRNAARCINSFIQVNERLLKSERKKGYPIELWGDVSLLKERIGFNQNRGAGFVVSPKIVKDICRIDSNENDRIVAVLKGHGHLWELFNSQEKKPKEGFIHQIPISGNHPFMESEVEKKDVFYILQVKPKVRDWELLGCSSDNLEKGYSYEEKPFYGEPTLVKNQNLKV